MCDSNSSLFWVDRRSKQFANVGQLSGLLISLIIHELVALEFAQMVGNREQARRLHVKRLKSDIIPVPVPIELTIVNSVDQA